MRNSNCVVAILLTTAILAPAHAADPSRLGLRECSIVSSPRIHAMRCAPAKPLTASAHFSAASLHFAVCASLLTRIERDTCFNRVEATT